MQVTEYRKCLYCNKQLINRNQQTCFCNDRCYKLWTYKGLPSALQAQKVAEARELPILRTKLTKGDKHRVKQQIVRFCKWEPCSQFFITTNPNKFYHREECQVNANKRENDNTRNNR